MTLESEIWLIWAKLPDFERSIKWSRAESIGILLEFLQEVQKFQEMFEYEVKTSLCVENDLHDIVWVAFEHLLALPFLVPVPEFD